MTFTLALCLQVTSRRLWKVVYNELGGSPGSTSAATCTRRHYEKWVSPITATSPWHCANRPQLARWLWSVWFCSPNRRLMLPYEQQIKGGNQQPSKPKAPVASAASIRKPVRGRIPSAPRKNGVTSQVRAFLKKKILFAYDAGSIFVNMVTGNDSNQPEGSGFWTWFAWCREHGRSRGWIGVRILYVWKWRNESHICLI